MNGPIDCIRPTSHIQFDMALSAILVTWSDGTGLEKQILGLWILSKWPEHDPSRLCRLSHNSKFIDEVPEGDQRDPESHWRTAGLYHLSSAL